MNDSPTNNTLKLPITRILVLTVQLIKQRLNTFMRLGLPLIVVAIFATFININNENVFKILFELNANPLVTLLIMIIIWSIFIMVTVGCHRGFLINETKIHQTKIFRWQTKEWKFVGWSLLIGLIIGVLAMIFGFVISFFGIIPLNGSTLSVLFNQLLFLPIMYFFSRWSLIFPSIALEDPDASMAEAWALSEGNGWRLTFLITIVPFIIDLVFSLFPVFDSILFRFVSVIVWLLTAVFGIGLLSLSYAFLKGNFKSDDEIVI